MDVNVTKRVQTEDTTIFHLKLNQEVKHLLLRGNFIVQAVVTLSIFILHLSYITVTAVYIHIHIQCPCFYPALVSGRYLDFH